VTTGKSRHFDTVTIGDVIVPVTFRADLPSLIKYAAATWDFHPYHYDADFVRRAGMPAPVADGQMFGALMARMMMSWGGPDAFVRRLNFRLRAPVFVGETVHITGRVVSKSMQDGAPLVGAQLTIVKDGGNLVVQNAAAAIELPSANL
jgi:acyl dehydratase